jgi:hypothetical protein
MSQFRFLGINITNNLKWSSHIQALCLKLNKVCYITKSLKDVVSFCTVRNIYVGCRYSLRQPRKNITNISLLIEYTDE